MNTKEALERIKDDIEIGYLATKHDNPKDKNNYLVLLKSIEKELEQLEELKKGFDLLEPYFYLFDQHKYNNNMSEYSNYRYVLIDCEGYYNFITKEQFYLLKKLGIKEYLI